MENFLENKHKNLKFVNYWQNYIPCFQILTKKEKQIIIYIVSGYDHKQISSFLNKSPEVVKWHLNRIYKKWKTHLYSKELKKTSNHNILALTTHKFYINVLKTLSR